METAPLRSRARNEPVRSPEDESTVPPVPSTVLAETSPDVAPPVSDVVATSRPPLSVRRVPPPQPRNRVAIYLGCLAVALAIAVAVAIILGYR
jgi:hypothetical protein